MQTIIVGQGLAGTAVAWELYRRGQEFLIVDPGDAQSASKVAAGLITPVAGKRFAVAGHFTELYDRAVASYSEIERRLRRSCFGTQPALRLCYSDDEVELFEQRADWLRGAGFADTCEMPCDGHYRKSRLAVLMPGAARLNTRVYLEQSREFFAAKQQLLTERVTTDSLMISNGEISCEPLHLKSHRVIFCGGHQDQGNPWIPEHVFNSAKGEILTVRIEGLAETRTVHARKSWLCPTHKEDVYLFGATYEHDAFDYGTTEKARCELEQRLRGIVALPFQVIDQHYGIRPIGMQRKAIVGRNFEHPGVSWLNGLGSKGALLAPYLASVLVDNLLADTPVCVELTEAHTHG